MNQNESQKEAVLFLKRLEKSGIRSVFLNPSTSVKSQESSPQNSPIAIPTKSSDLKTRILEFRDQVLTCTKCDELANTRNHVVFGAGNIKAKLVIVGEAPGAQEDEEGLPFVGRAGKLLTKIIESIGLSRQDVFICNVLKCRPPKNRPPKPEEVRNCEPYLKHQLALIRPKVICALGTFAAQTLLKRGEPISRLRGQFFDYEGIPLMCTFHPAYLLRSPGEKRKVWEDMKKIRKLLTSSS